MLSGTEGAQYPFWSPDSRWIAYTKNTGNMHEVISLYDLKER